MFKYEEHFALKPKKVMCKDCTAASLLVEEDKTLDLFKCHRYAPRTETVDGGFFPAIVGQDDWCMEGIEKEKEGEK